MTLFQCVISLFQLNRALLWSLFRAVTLLFYFLEISQRSEHTTHQGCAERLALTERCTIFTLFMQLFSVNESQAAD